MSRFSHRQPVWTFSTVVLLSTLLLSPVATSAVLRALMQSMLSGERISVYPTEQSANPTNANRHRPASEAERQPEEPRRIEEDSFESTASDGERLLPVPENDCENRAESVTSTNSLADLAFLLPTRIVLMVPDDPRLTRLPPFANVVLRWEVRLPVPPRAPPFSA
jgi:hypothetical protein